jgi:hypothetical protein
MIDVRRSRWLDRGGRFRVPFAMRWLSAVPIPRAARRWYYRLSIRVAGHPSNWHWKMFTWCGFGSGDSEPSTPPVRWPRRQCDLRPGERCPWCGGYCELGASEEAELGRV